MFHGRFPIEIVLAALATLALFIGHRRYPVLSAKALHAMRAVAERQALWIVVAMLLPVAFRLALLPWFPAPVPRVYDEFSHLLVADTLLSGRLTNPPHPLSRHLETFYTLQEPTYSSIYPIGQGLVIAAGQFIFGHPWAGILLAMALMCGAITWMLYAVVPARWAALGGVLTAAQFGFSSYWVTSYWGGAFGGFGGALVFGGMWRLTRAPSAGPAFAVGVGWAVVWLVRPYESAFLAVLIWAWIAWLIARAPSLWMRRVPALGLIVALQVSAGLVTALHNRAVTGSALRLPYQLSKTIYGVPQGFIWQAEVEAPPFRFRKMEPLYEWQRGQRQSVREQPLTQYAHIVRESWGLFVGYWYTVPFLLALGSVRARAPSFAAALIVIVLASSILYPFFAEHYVAAYTCLFMFLVVHGLMMLARWSYQGRAVGRVAVVFLVLGGLLAGVRDVHVTEALGWRTRPVSLRQQLVTKLQELGGRHLVFVRYGPTHVFHDEWVSNRASIDDSEIVWLRASALAHPSQVLAYFQDRRAWLAEVEPDTARIFNYGPPFAGGTPGSEIWVLRR